MIKFIFLVYLCTLLNISSKSTSKKQSDSYYMSKAVELAATAIGKTSPNPCVGCIIVDDDGNIISEGYHKKAGLAHAEVEALTNAGDKAKQATAYVSLEPCNHHGRTPPCTEALLKHGVKRVVAAMVDPDPRVSGKGLQYLRQHGIIVDVGIQEDKAKELNAPFIYRVLTGRPYVICASSHSLDRDISIVSNENDIPNIPKMNMNNLLEIQSAISPEVDTIILYVNELSQEDMVSLLAIPEHIRLILIDVGSIDSTILISNRKISDYISSKNNETVTNDINEKKDDIQFSVIDIDQIDVAFKPLFDDTELSEEERIAMATEVKSRGVQTTVASISISSPTTPDINNNSNDVENTDLTTRFVSTTTVLKAVINHVVKLGSNAVMIYSSDDSTSINHKNVIELSKHGYIQKLMMITPSTCTSKDEPSNNSDNKQIGGKLPDSVAELIESIIDPYIYAHSHCSPQTHTDSTNKAIESKLDMTRFSRHQITVTEEQSEGDNDRDNDEDNNTSNTSIEDKYTIYNYKLWNYKGH